MRSYDLGVMGEFYQKSPTLNINTVLGYFTSHPATLHNQATIEQEVQFPDVSFYQGEIDYSVMCTKTDAIIIRAGQGTWPDEQFERNYQEAKKCGKKVGVYWFYDDRASPLTQANLLIALLRGKALEMEVYIDWENSYGGQFGDLSNVVAMMELVEKANLNIKGVGLYTGYYFFVGHTNPIRHRTQYEYLKTHPLWLAWYTTNPDNVRIPAPWSDLLIWQWGTPVLDWGQETLEIDMNWFNGSKQEFDTRYGGSMAEFVEIESLTGSNHSIRRPTAYPTSPHILGATFATLLAGTTIQAGINDYYVYAADVFVNGVKQAYVGDKWWKVLSGGQEGWIAERHKGVDYVSVTPVEPPPSPLHVVEVYIDGVLKCREEF